MRRVVAGLWICLGLLVGVVGWASAHNLALFGHLAVDAQGEVVVRLVDGYGGRVEGQQVKAHATAPGGKPTRPVAMAETSPGTYRSQVTMPGAERYEVTIDLELGGDLHRIVYPVRAGEAQAEATLPMAQIDPVWPWSRVLFVAAAVVLAVGSVLAWRRRPPDGGGVEAGAG